MAKMVSKSTFFIPLALILLNIYLFLHRNSGSGNGLHSLQVVIAMRGKLKMT